MAVLGREVVRELATEKDLTIKQAEEVIEAYWNLIEKHVEAGEEVKVHGRVKFSSVVRAERKGRNPQTGEEITIPERTVVVVKPYKRFKDLAK